MNEPESTESTDVRARSRGPADRNSVVPEGIRELLDQRSTYQQWLDRLEEVGDKYRSDVAERVRGDYRSRLREVAEQLEGHRHELVSSLEERRGLLEDLTAGYERRSAELEEAELRHTVGEYDDETWDERRSELSEVLADIEADLHEARGAVDELEHVLGELSSGSGADGAIPLYASTGKAATAGAATGSPAGGTTESDPRREAEAPTAANSASSDAAAEDGLESGAGSDAESAAGAAERGGDADRGFEAEEPGAVEEDEPIAAGAKEPVAVEADTDASAEATYSRGSAGERSTRGRDERATKEGGTSEDGEYDDGDYLDELEFLESLSLDDPDSFDAVSKMLEEEEDR